MQSRWGKGAFILPRGVRRRKKTGLNRGKLMKPEGQGLVGKLLIVEFLIAD
jgi:hypothetical protein